MIERLDKEIAQAMREKDSARVGTLRMLKNSLNNARIEAGKELEEADCIRILQKEAKQRKESIEGYEAAGRDEQAAAERQELALIEQYLPKKLSSDELEQLVADAIAETGAQEMSDLGTVMKVLQPRVAGRAEGSEVAALVRQQLS